MHSALPAPAAPPNAASIRQVSQNPDISSVQTQSIHRLDQTRQSTPHDGGAAPLKPDDEQAIRDRSLPDPQMTTMTTLVRPIVQRSMTVYPNVAVAQPERSRTVPLPSTSYTASASGNVASTAVTASHPVRLRENSLVGTYFFQTTYTYPLTNHRMHQPLARTPPAQLTGSTYVQPHSQSSKSTSTSRSVERAVAASPEPMEIDPDLPTLNLRALTLNRASSSHRQTASRTHSPPPPSPTRPPAAEDDEIEDLYGPPLGLPSVHAPPPPEPPQPTPAPAPPRKETRMLPAIAAEDPRILAALERHEQREAARPRQGMHKAPAVRGAGAKRGRLVLVADFDRTRTEPMCRDESPRGVFASYFSRRSPGRPTLS